ncbi:MAG: putative membrane protein YiaA, partial [Nonlabens sp.]
MEHQVNYKTEKKEVRKSEAFTGKPTAAFIAASWTALLVGMVSYCVGLWRSDMLLNER